MHSFIQSFTHSFIYSHIHSLVIGGALQVAHFYNTIDQQMIPSQRPMMLGLALAFEQIIKVLGLWYRFFFYCYIFPHPFKWLKFYT